MNARLKTSCASSKSRLRTSAATDLAASMPTESGDETSTKLVLGDRIKSLDLLGPLGEPFAQKGHLGEELGESGDERFSGHDSQ